MARRLLAATVLVSAVLSGCTWQASEPGLFRPPTTRPSDSASSPEPVPPPQPTNPRLPVAGEQVWTSADGTGATVRIAVHAVRRLEGATVLDWSVTPLSAPGLRLGSALPPSLDLGLSLEAGSSVDVVLVDGDRVSRPLAHRSPQVFHHCLCTQVWLTQQSMRIGQTALLQVAYPALPAAVRFVDVVFGTVPAVFHVPVTPVGLVPTAQQPSDLRRPVRAASLDASYRFRYPTRPDRRQRIRVDRVLAGPGYTSLAWTIETLNDQASVRVTPFGPPVNRVPPGPSVVNANPTDGLALRPGGRGPELRASWMTADIYGRAGFECLCTELGVWAAQLWSDGGSAQVVTTYPALPPGTREVDVVLPGVGVLEHVAVEPAADAAAQLGPDAPAAPGAAGWAYAEDAPPRAWTTNDWPTPLPDPAQLGDYRARPGRVSVAPPA